MTNISDKIITLVEQAKQAVARNVNSAMVFTYYHIGRLLVEEWQQGEERAEYGTQLIATVSTDLTRVFGRGFSVPNLERMRNFFLIYSNCSKELRDSAVFRKSSNCLRISDDSPISSTVSRKSDESPISASVMRKSGKSPISSTVSRKSDESPIFQPTSGIFEYETDVRFLPISWSHYSFLIRIKDEVERQFYEVESFQNQWSVRELERQFNTGLFERLAASRNPSEILRLAKEGQIVERPQDLIKDPLILDFLGLEGHSGYTETELETAIINQIEKFMLELGKGFFFGGRQVRFSFNEEHYCLVKIRNWDRLVTANVKHSLSDKQHIPILNVNKALLCRFGVLQPLPEVFCADRPENRQAKAPGPGTNADVCQLLRPLCQGGRRKQHHRNRDL